MKLGKKTKRAGFSLIELIITIAIMAIFVGVASLSIGLLRSADTRGLASSINDSLTDLKSYTESHRGPFYLYIYKVDDEGYYSHFQEEDTFTAPTSPIENDKRLGTESLKVTYNDDTGEHEIVQGGGTDGKGFARFRIQKKDGAYLTAPKSLYVYKGSSVDYKVILTKDTGLHYMDQ